jgi:hypothetical protein
MSKSKEFGMIFRVLEQFEEEEFRKWARDNEEDLREREAAGTLDVHHPTVRDEWEKMKAEAKA